MAIFKSFILSSISGSVNGTTFSRNASGAYMRNKTMPVNPNTEIQVQTRAGFTNAATSWRDMTDGERSAWKTYAQNSPQQNSVGDTIHLSGFAQYMRLNGLRTFLDLAVQNTAPLQYGSANAITTLVGVLDETGNDFTVSSIGGGSFNADATYAFWISNPIGAGQTFYKGPWNYLGKAPGTTVGAFNAVTPMTLTNGQQYMIKARLIDEFDRLSPIYQTSKITVTTV